MQPPVAADTQVKGIIGPDEDLDLFKIELPTQADVVMYTSGNPDTIGRLLDYRGVQIASNDDSSMSEGKYDFFIGETLEPGVYYVAVLAYDEGPYRLHVETVSRPGQQPPDSGEPGPGLFRAWFHQPPQRSKTISG